MVNIPYMDPAGKIRFHGDNTNIPILVSNLMIVICKLNLLIHFIYSMYN